MPDLSSSRSTTTTTSVSTTQAISTYGNLPLQFEPNEGQTDARVSFLGHGPGYTLFLTSLGATLAFVQRAPHRPGLPVPVSSYSRLANPLGGNAETLTATVPETVSVVHLGFAGAALNAHPTLTGEDPLSGRVNYFRGKQSDGGWHANILTYGRVTYHDVYPGIDVTYYGTQGHTLEYDWRVAPGADPSAIRMDVEGVQSMTVDGQGVLVLHTAVGDVQQRAPVVYQDVDGQRLGIPTRYVLTSGRQVRFAVGAYDARRPLVIDPVLSYSTYLSTGNELDAIAVDSAGDAYVTGRASVNAPTFPTTTGAYSTTSAGSDDVVITKLNARGSALLYSTFLGGRRQDQGYGIAVDQAGIAYIVGKTASTDFPTMNAAQAIYGGGAANAFVAALSADGSSLLYSTYLGGSQDDEGHGIAVDSTGNAYITGNTNSNNFPLANAYQTTFTSAGCGAIPPCSDAFIAKVNTRASGPGSLVYSTYLGGNDNDGGNAIGIDGAGNAYVCGSTYSHNFPTTAGALVTNNPYGYFYGFVAALNTTGNTLLYGTYLGSGTSDGAATCTDIAVDTAGHAYVTGNAGGAFPTVNAVQTSPHGSRQPYAAELDTTGSTLLYSTFLGGNTPSGGPYDQGLGIAVDRVGYVYVTGTTASETFPVTNAFQASLAGPNDGSSQDAYIAKLDMTQSGAASLLYSSYLGGAQSGDVGLAVAADATGNAYIAGQTNGLDFPYRTVIQAPVLNQYGYPAGPGQFMVKVGSAPPGGGIIPWHARRSVGLANGLIATVDLNDGHVDITANDMHLPGRGLPLTLRHTWDSALAQEGITTTAGQGWQTSVNPNISGVLTGTVVYTDETGATWPFTFTGAMTTTGPYTTYQTLTGLPWQLSVATSPTTTYTLTNILTGITRTFDTQGRLLADASTYGVGNTLSYGPTGVLTATNSGGRLLQMAYSNGLLTDLKSSGSQHVTYAYTNTTQLASLTRGAGTGDAAPIKFGYNGTQLISVTTPYMQAARTWALGYDPQGRVTNITSPMSGTIPAYTTQFTYAPGQTQVVEGYGSPAPITTTYTLDAQGEATAVQDALGNTSTASYDGDHDIVTSTDALSNTTAYSYTYVGPNQTVGLLTQQIDPPTQASFTTTNTLQSSITTYKYNANNDLTEVDQPAGGITLYGYDGNRHTVITTTQLLQSNAGGGTGCGQMVVRTATQQMRSNVIATASSCVNDQWRAAVHLRDAYGEITGTVDGRGVDVSTSVTPTVALDPANAPLFKSRYAYSAQGDLISVSTPPLTTTLNAVLKAAQPVTTTYGYDSDGNQTVLTSTNGSKTTVTYDHLGRPLTTTAPAVTLYDRSAKSPSTTLGYDGDGAVVSAVDALGDRATASYDPLGRMVARTNPLGRTQIYTYTGAELTATQDYSGAVTSTGYDRAGRPIASTDPLGTQTQATLDAMGNTTAITTPLDYAHVLTTTVDLRGYDALSRPISESVQGTGGASPARPQVSTTSYDADGNTAVRVSPVGGLTYSQYDLADRPVQTSLYTSTGSSPLADLSYTLDVANNLTRAQDLAGQNHSATFDGANRTSQRLDCTFSCLGTSIITTTPRYDPDGNIVALTQTLSTGATTTTVAGYNALDWMTSQNDGLGTTSYGYDAAGRRRTQSLLGGQGVVTATVDQASNTTGIGEFVTDTVTSTIRSSGASTFGYTPDNRPLTDTLDSGGGTASVTGARTYDGDNRMTGLRVSGTSLIYNESYGYDAQGHTVALTTSIAAATPQQFTYDANGWVQGQSPLTGPGAAESWQYDANGNLRQAAHGGAVLTYNYAFGPGQATPPNALPNELVSTLGTGSATTGYGYDNNGNTTSIVQSTNGYDLTYDTQERLTTVVLTDTSGLGRNATVAISYNARGLRARDTVTKRGQSLPSFDERLLYRGSQVGQVAVTGTQVTTPFTETFLYRSNGSPLELLIRQAGKATARYWYVLDGRGNVTAVVDATGAVVNRYYYDAWGTPTSPDGGTTPATTEAAGVHQPLRYGGYWYDGWDDSLGSTPDQGWNAGALPWYTLGPRSFDPALERFLQPDPATSGSLPNYVYAHNDPLDVTDPTGMAGEPMGCASSAYVGTAGNAAGCARAGAQQAADAQVNAVLWAPANFLVLDPLRNTFGPGKSLVDRALGAASLLPFVGVVGHGLGLAADAVRGLQAVQGLEATAALGDTLTSFSSAGIAAGQADRFAQMVTIRLVEKGEKLADLFDELKGLTWYGRNEHALVKLLSGERAIVAGSDQTIGLVDEAGNPLVTHVFAHTHPPGQIFYAGPSSADIRFIMGSADEGGLGQTRSWLLEEGQTILFGPEGVR